MRRPTILAASAAALAGLAPAAEAIAQSTEEQPDGPGGGVPGEFRFYAENDFFNGFTEQTDRYYTQGMRAEWLRHSSRSDSNFLPGISHEDWCSLLCGPGADAEIELGNVNTGYAVGQNMYTPENVGIAAPQPYDRPWAGYLYGSRIARIRYEERTLKAQRQDRIELSLGIVGPASFAKETQIQWHEWWGFDPLLGWDNQLRNEPVVQLSYESALRWQTSGNTDVIPRVRANLGNALVSLEGDLTLRFGWNLSGFGVQPIPTPPPPALAGSGQAKSALRAGWRPTGNLFLRAGMKAIAHNIFIDGNSFASNDIRIDRKPFVPEIALGFEVKVARNCWVTYQFIRRGSEFRSWLGRDAARQDFGAITLAWSPR